MKRLLLLLLLLPATAHAQIPAPGSGDMPPAESFLERHLDIGGYLRIRMDTLENLDLNHGITPTTGQTLFPTSPSDPGATIFSANMRMRLEPSIRIGWGVSIHARIDLLDNLVLGSTPEGLPATAWVPMSAGSASQSSPEAGENANIDAIRVKRVWGEVLTPIGVLSAGRMGAIIDWGTGFFINSGSCIDCDRGDGGDRIAFAMPILGHLIAAAFDFGASGPTSEAARADAQPFNVDGRDDVLSGALAIARYDTPEVIERYRRAGRMVLQYGLVGSIRTQEYDVPAYYLTGDLSRQYTDDDYVRRGLLAVAGDLWFGLRYQGWTLDMEAALLYSRIENGSLLPGTEFIPDVTALQWGGVARASHAWEKVDVGFEVGLASGDDAPGFGVRLPLTQTSTQPGDMDGPQMKIPGDATVNNFRFNPDYHVDQILWRRIIGTVTDAIYLRPRVTYEPISGLRLEGTLIASLAMEPASTPSGERPLGVELDLSVSYRMEWGFMLRADYGVLFPLAGLNNTRLGLDAEPAQVLHIILAYLL